MRSHLRQLGGTLRRSFSTNVEAIALPEIVITRRCADVRRFARSLSPVTCGASRSHTLHSHGLSLRSLTFVAPHTHHSGYRR